jgi:tripartite-type tricarboxylate transporter receptor subunit TctC
VSKPQVVWHAAATCTILALAVWWITQLSTNQTSNDYPNRPIHIVVPYAAGGGSDTFVRIVQQGIDEDGLLGQPLVIINQAGGIGTIGSREIKNSEPDGYKILCHHNAIITAKLTETVAYGPEAFEPIALTGEMSMVIVVRADAKFQNIKDLLEQAKAAPKTIRFGANKGAPAYFTTLQLEKTWPGAEFSIVSSGGGADRYSKVLGGHLEAGIFSLSEFLDFRAVAGTPPDQDIRAIALLSPTRHESVPDVPTTVEMGVPVVLNNANYWWAPLGTPQPILDQLASVLDQAMQNQTVRSELKRLRMDPTFDRGDSFKARLDETVRQFEEVVAQKQTALPNFTLYTSIIVGMLLVWMLVEAARDSNKHDSPDPLSEGEDFVRRPGVAIACFAALGGYVWLLSQGWLPFAIASAAMVLVVGGIMMRSAAGRWIVLIELALLTGLGAQFVFTEILVTPLP